jgi:DNA-binding MarR family transcriptional regulator
MTRAENGIAVPGPVTGERLEQQPVQAAAEPGDERPEQQPVRATEAAEPGGEGQGDARQLTDVVARLRRVLRASIRADYPWESLPMAQVELLQSLAETAPARVGDLAARQRLAPSTVSGLISQMINAGLVERGTDPRDRRVAVVALSEAGREQLAEWNAAHQRRIAAALAELEPAERAAIDGALPALARLVDQLAQQRDEAAGSAQI